MTFQPPAALPLKAPGASPFFENIEAETEDEQANLIQVREHMTELMRTPKITAGAVMPDACPAGPKGTIPVGGIAVSEAIHPGMHSADICCSMAISVYPGVAPACSPRRGACRHAFRTRRPGSWQPRSSRERS